MRCFPLVLLLALTPGFAFAWPESGIRVTGAQGEQVAPSIVSDGQGGAYLTWIDYRAYRDGGPLSDGVDLYIQHVTTLGGIAPGWPADGLAVATGPGHQNGGLVADGSGGVLVLFTDTNVDFGDLYLQRITAAGAVAPGWPVGGVPIGVGPGDQYAPDMIPDGAGGAFVSWQVGSEIATTAARITHVLGNGQLAAGWPANGRLFEPTAYYVGRPLLLGTDTGGFLACWAISEDPAFSTVRVLAQRFLPDGSADSAWPTGGVTVCAQRSSPENKLVSDSAGGFYVLLMDYRNSPPASPFAEEDLYLQHILADGRVAADWPAEALPVAALPGVDVQGKRLTEDARGGVYATWQDSRSGFPQIFGLHIGPDAQRYPGWPEGGLRLCSRPTFQFGIVAAPDGMGGAYFAWVEPTAEGRRLYLKRVTETGAPALGWPADGLLVSSAEGEQDEPEMVEDGSGGVIVAWDDSRDYQTTFSDIYAQRFANDGVVAAQVSLAGVEAFADEVRLRWRVSGETRARVERRVGDAGWREIAQLEADGAGYMSHVDRDVVPGARYGYRLAFASGARGGETTVEVPALALALEGARPNPAVGALWLAFTLPDASPARLGLYDLAGRQVVSRDVGAHGPGRHVVRLDDGALKPGLYWASLTHSGRTLRARVAIAR